MLSVLIECIDIDAEVQFFREALDCRIHLVSPADDPSRVVMHVPGGGAVEILRAAADSATSITIPTKGTDHEVSTPGGTVVRLRSLPSQAPLRLGAAMEVPTNRPTLTVVEGAEGSFGVGRASMEYRDLLPDRWGGRFIASHIRICDGGEVADWVHFHRIRFQMIYVAAGWVDVVYEDQGEPFRMHAGDCVLQPPEIRHRVLRSSPGVEVIEIGCPAEHDTLADHDLQLPTTRVDGERLFSGQRFVRHVAHGSIEMPWGATGLMVRDTGIGTATDGLAGVVVTSGSVDADRPGPMLTHGGEIVMLIGLSGNASIEIDGTDVELTPRGSIALPSGTKWRWGQRSGDHEALVVSLPAGTADLV